MPGSDPLEPAFSAVAQQILATVETPGAAVAISVDERVQAGGVGYADSDGREALPPDARFPLYSISKTYLAVVILRLVQMGQFGLDDHLATVLPDRAPEQPITIRQLLNHTAGVPDYGGMPDYSAALRRDPAWPWTTDGFLQRTLGRGLLFNPGKGWRYSNVGYLMLRLVIERVTGSSLKAALHRLVIEPLGLLGTTVIASPADLRACSPGFSAQFVDVGMLGDVRAIYHPGWVSHGLVGATASDVARFLDAVVRGRILNDALLAEMLAPVMVRIDHRWMRKPAYGLGVMIDADSPHGLVMGHAGGGPGYSTAAFHFGHVGGRAVTVVALANRDHEETGVEIAFRLADRARTMHGRSSRPSWRRHLFLPGAGQWPHWTSSPWLDGAPLARVPISWMLTLSHPGATAGSKAGEACAGTLGSRSGQPFTQGISHNGNHRGPRSGQELRANPTCGRAVFGRPDPPYPAKGAHGCR